MRSSRVLPIPIRIPLVNGIDSRPRDANLAEPGQFLPTHHASIDMRKQAGFLEDRRRRTPDIDGGRIAELSGIAELRFIAQRELRFAASRLLAGSRELPRVADTAARLPLEPS